MIVKQSIYVNVEVVTEYKEIKFHYLPFQIKSHDIRYSNLTLIDKYDDLINSTLKMNHSASKILLKEIDCPVARTASNIKTNTLFIITP